MRVTGIIPRGYCKGVVRAVNIVKESVEQYQPLYILGMIVHNEYIVHALKDIGAITLDDPHKTRLELLDSIDHGTVVITAHGTGDNVKEKALNKGLRVIDATCLDVLKTHDLIKEAIHSGKEVLYIGKKGHPEAEGSLSLDDKHIHLITHKNDFKQYDPNKEYLITNQTTMSLYDVYKMTEDIQDILPKATLAKEICHATSVRQKAIASMDEDIDIVIIVGDPHSNNTKKLASIAKTQAHKDVYMVESINDLDINWLFHKKHVAVSSGASTPTSLTNQIIDFLKQFDENNPDTYSKPKIEYDKILQ